MKSENELGGRGWPIQTTSSGWLLNSLAINCRAIRLNRAIPPPLASAETQSISSSVNVYTRLRRVFTREYVRIRRIVLYSIGVQMRLKCTTRLVSFLTWPCVDRWIVQCRSTRDPTVNEIVFIESLRISFKFSFVFSQIQLIGFLLRDCRIC